MEAHRPPVADSNLLHRGGVTGLAFARSQASAFMAPGGVGQPGLCERAAAIHQAFVARDLSPGGCADLLAMALFVDREDA
jgi:triphosphoribosyl-dephospho-CoA synthase